MIGGMARIVQDVAPYMLAEGNPAEIRGTNAVGMKRRGLSPACRRTIKEACKIMFRSGLNLKSAIEKLKELEDDTGEIEKIIEFAETTSRGLTGI